jgi:hypothetical protein
LDILVYVNYYGQMRRFCLGMMLQNMTAVIVRLISTLFYT